MKKLIAKNLMVSGAMVLGLITFNAHAEEIVLEESQSGSITVFGCPSCKKEADKEPEMAAGTQKFEMLDHNGEKKLYRTENWLGGSAVSFLHISPEGTKATELVEVEQELPVLNPEIGAEEAMASTIDQQPVSSIGDRNDVFITTDVMIKGAAQEAKPVKKIVVTTQMPAKTKLSQPVLFDVDDSANDSVKESALPLKPNPAEMTPDRLQKRAGEFALRLN